MKKFLAAFGILSIALVATEAMAANPASILVRVTPVGTRDVTINSPADVDFGSLAIGASAVASTGIDIENSGNISQSYRLNLNLAGGTGTLWTSSTTAGADMFALYATFNGAVAPAAGDFDVTGGANGDHVLTTTRDASASRYAGSETGINVSPVAAVDNRMLWLRLDMPTSSTSTNTEEQFNLVVTAF